MIEQIGFDGYTHICSEAGLVHQRLSVYHYKPYSTPDPHTVTQVPFKAHSPEMLAGSSKNVWLSGDEFLKSDISATVRLTFVVWTDLVDEF